MDIWKLQSHRTLYAKFVVKRIFQWVLIIQGVLWLTMIMKQEM